MFFVDLPILVSILYYTPNCDWNLFHTKVSCNDTAICSENEHVYHGAWEIILEKFI